MEPLALSKILTNFKTVREPPTMSLFANSRFTLLARVGKATLRLKLVWSLTAAHHEIDQVLSTIIPNQNWRPRDSRILYQLAKHLDSGREIQKGRFSKFMKYQKHPSFFFNFVIQGKPRKLEPFSIIFLFSKRSIFCPSVHCCSNFLGTRVFEKRRTLGFL